MILLVLLGAGLLVIEFNQPQNGLSFPPYSKEGIKIENETVYSNGTVYFSARCYFTSYGLPEPDGDQY